MIGALVKPGWDVPSIVTGPAIDGKPDATAIVWAPDPMANSRPSGPAAAVAAARASRSVQFATVHVPSPGSATSLTMSGGTSTQAENSEGWPPGAGAGGGTKGAGGNG